MAKLSIENTTLKNIASAIRSKGGTVEQLTPLEMPDAIRAIEGGGGSDTPKLRTPEEVYAQERPADWPVLPEPTQENEFYFLCGRNGTEKNVALPSTGQSNGSCLMEWGYIGDDGAFVPVYTIDSQSLGGSSWNYFGLNNHYDEEHMSKYYVLHTVGADTSYDNATTSTQVSNSWVRFVLEMKVRHSNPKFRTGGSNGSTPGSFRSCEFITFYGPQNWTDVAGKFGRMYSLKALLFDSEENNPFLKDLTSLTNTSATYMFIYDWALLCYYPIDKWSKITTTNACYAYTGLDTNYFVYETDRGDYSSTTYQFISPIRASIKVPNMTNTGLASSSIKYFDNLDVSGYTASGHSSNLNKMTTGSIEINNLKVGPVSLTSTNVLYSTLGDTTTSYRYLKKVTMSPEQTGDNMPSSWTIAFPVMSYSGVKLFLNSLPTVTNGNKLTIYHSVYCREIPQDLIDIAVGKGYTISFSAA